MYEEGNKHLNFNWTVLIIKLLVLVAIIFLAAWIFVRIGSKNGNISTKLASSDNSYIENITYMKSAAIEYFTPSRLPEKVGETVRVSLNDMLNQKLLIDFTDDGKKCNVNDSYVQATKTADGNYALKVSLTCDKKSDFIVTSIDSNKNTTVVVDESKNNNSQVTPVNNNTNNTSTNVANSSKNTSTKTNTSSSSSQSSSKTTKTVVETVKTTINVKVSCTTNCNGNSNVDLSKAWYLVKFNSNGGTAVFSQNVLNGNTATRPLNPVRDGYTFVEWQLNGVTYDFNTQVKSNIELDAVWQKNSVAPVTYSVVFNSNGGTSVSTQIVNANGYATRPLNPVRSGYIFRGWYLNGYAFDFNTRINNNIVLDAYWERSFVSNTTRYYEYVKYSDWIDGYSDDAKAINEKVTNTTYNYCTRTPESFYSTSWVYASSNPYTYTYELQLLDLDTKNIVPGTVEVYSKSFFEDSYADYTSYQRMKRFNSIAMTGNDKRFDAETVDVATFKASSLKSTNFSFNISNVRLVDGVYRATVTVNYRNDYGVVPYTSSNSTIKGPIYFVPIKFNVSYSYKHNCVRAASNSVYSMGGYNAVDPETTVTWRHKVPVYKWSTDTYLDGYSYTGNYKDIY